MMITVFTPTYNRGLLLRNIFDCLNEQTYRSFEWIIVDDGSTDNTESIVEHFTSWFPIRYFKQENHGKHTAINRGVSEAKGELFLIVDSDDELPLTSLQDITQVYDTIKGNSDFAGVCGMMAHRNGIRISSVMENVDCNEIDLKYKYHVDGDLCEIFRTSVLKEFPFPVFEGEKFCPEALVWFRIASKYKLRVFNKVVYYRDYLDGGLTDRIVRIRKESPKATDLTYREMMHYKIPIKFKIRAFINLLRFRFLSRI